MTAAAQPDVEARRLKRAALATGVVFALSGTNAGTWASRIPAVRDQVDASKGEIGLALLALAVGSLLVMPLTGRATQRWSSRSVVLVMAVLCMSALAVIPFAPGVLALSGMLLVYGAGFGSWDVAMNVHGHAVEQRAGRAWMPRYHAAWSAGGVLGAGIGALAAAAGLPLAVHFGLVALVGVALLVASLRLFVDDRAAVWHPVEERMTEPRGRLLSVHLALLGLITICATFTEGAATDWLALLLRDTRGVAESVAAAGYGVFASAMMIGRFVGTPVIGRLGRAGAVRLGGLAALVGVVLAVLGPGLVSALIGCALWGVGVSLTFPAAMSAAGDTPGRSADAIAAVSTIGYGGFLLGPPIIGYVADAIGLDRALLIVGLLAAGIVVLSPALRERRGVDRTAAGATQAD
jgi:fucose permease